MPLLEEKARLALLIEAESYTYTLETGVVGTGERLVRKHYHSFEAFPESSLYVRLQQEFQALMEEQLVKADAYPFTTPLSFNSTVLQKYEPGTLGITAHRDIKARMPFFLSTLVTFFRDEFRRFDTSHEPLRFL